MFYHGTKWREIGNKIFEVFDTKYSNQVDKFLQGHYFSSSKKIARTYNANNIYKVFLNAKNPLVIDFKGHTFNDYIDEAINNIPKSVQENIRDFYDSIIFKNIIDDSTQNGKKHPVADTIMVLDSNQIKHIENRGIESEQGRKYFNESSPNIFHSNPHAGAGLLGGSVAGVEQDENGNITFSPEKFALGLLGGTGGSIAISKAKNTLKSTQNAQGQRVEIQADQNTLTYKTQETQYIGALRASLKEALKPYLNKELVNKATGISAQISSTGINKIASKVAVDKSIANGFTRDEHFKVAGDLKNLFENATKKTSYTDKKHSKDILSMHRFFTQITINNKQAQAKMTLKESVEHGNKIYSLELEELIPSL